jgi:uncharacterized SAM-binding protein YcdF (DUF218 family)
MEYDAIIVLGRRLNEDGSLPQTAIERADKAIELFNQNLADRIITTGAHSFWDDKPSKATEAQALANYLISNGISEEKIFREEESVETIGNAYFSKVNILEPNQWKSIIVVTSDFHVARAEYNFKRVLGKEYNIRFEESEGPVSREEVEKEGKVLKLTKNTLGKVPIGDDSATKEFIFTVLPGYSENPKLTKEDIKEALK